MINNVRNTVLSIISKDNRGYITPEEFNQFAAQAQLEIFEKYFFDYSAALNSQNNGRIYTVVSHGSGYSDIPEKLAEVIDSFVESTVLHYNGTTLKFYKPGEDPLFPNESTAYRIDRIIYNDIVEIERVDRHRMINMTNSLVAPSVLYPVYTIDNQGVRIYPSTIVNNCIVEYIRYPYTPKWTYTTIGGGPIFNQSASDYQDFELPENDETNLIIKILQYAGVSIREAEIVAMAKQEELQNNEEKK
jgi:hypothetical protein